MKQFRSIEKIDTAILYTLELTSSISVLLLEAVCKELFPLLSSWFNRSGRSACGAFSHSLLCQAVITE